MPDKELKLKRAGMRNDRPVMLAIAGDSAAGKTTITDGIVNALGAERVTAVCVDDYHRYDRTERKDKPFTPLHPDCNYMDIMAQHLQLLATGQPILKPVYDHSSGELVRPELIEPREFVIIEGLLPLHSKLLRACFDVAVYLDPPEDVRIGWKMARDTSKRGYEEDAVMAELERREPESEEHIRPQKAHADIVVRFAPIEGRDDPENTPLSAELLLRPTIRHPDLSQILTDQRSRAMHVKMLRDNDGRPVDALHVHGYVPRDDLAPLEQAIWEEFDLGMPLPEDLGDAGDGMRSEPLAITQLLLLRHMLMAV
ncbi:MAG: phosphoribulokinase [Actinomycetota bacterium]|nr:phosphoribulokinase [Actinomycetota bacterium]